MRNEPPGNGRQNLGESILGGPGISRPGLSRCSPCRDRDREAGPGANPAKPHVHIVVFFRYIVGLPTKTTANMEGDMPLCLLWDYI